MTVLTKVVIAFLIVHAPVAISGQPQGDGFLGIQTTFGWHGGFSEVQGEEERNNVFSLSLIFVGASPNYGVFSKFVLLNDLIHISEDYSGSSDHLKPNELNSFSFFEAHVRYLSAVLWRNAILLVGLGTGHLGYNSPAFRKNPYTIFLSPSASIRWFLSGHFALLFEVDLPIGTYRRNAGKLWHFRNQNEIIFEPKGFIYSPLVYTIFIAVGWQYEHITLRTKTENLTAQVNKIKPYFRFTFLY